MNIFCVERRWLLFSRAALTIGAVLFVLSSVYLSQFNFDLHHDGYIFSQSGMLFRGVPASDVFMQYGLLYHAVVSLSLLTSDGNIYPSRIIAIIIVLMTVAICHFSLRSSMKCHHLGLTIWLLGCFWLSRYFQFFVQLTPSILALFLLSILFLIFCLRERLRINEQKTIVFCSFITVCLLHTKLNFGAVSILLCAVCFLTQGFKMSQVLLYCLTCIVFFCLTLFGVGYSLSEVRSVFGFHQNFVNESGFLNGLYRTFLLDPSHGGVHRPFLVLFYVPLLTISFHISMKFNLIGSCLSWPRISEVIVDRKNQLLAFFALACWLTIFPTGSYQHIWFGGLFGVLFLIRLIERLPISFKLRSLLLGSLLCVSLANFAYGFGSKVYHLEEFTHEGKGPYANIILSDEQKRFTDFVQMASQDNNYGECDILNLTPNGIYSIPLGGFCSIEDNGSNFFWASNNNLTFDQFVSRIKAWKGSVLATAPEFTLVAEEVASFSVKGQDFGTHFSLFKMHETELNIDDFKQYLRKARAHGSIARNFSNAWVPDSTTKSDLSGRVYFFHSCDLITQIYDLKFNMPLRTEISDECMMIYNKPILSDPEELVYLIIYLKLITTDRIQWTFM